MKTIETSITVSHDGTAIFELRLPTDVPAGRHRAVVVVDDRVAGAIAGSPLNSGLPVHDVGPWPEGLSLRREDFYGDDGR